VREVAIPLTGEAGGLDVERAIDDAIADSGLNVALRGMRRKFPGCTHWHLRREGESGTLEITFWPQQHRAWFTIQAGREAAWIDASLRVLLESIRRRMSDTRERELP
jgi:hypothetical protein